MDEGFSEEEINNNQTNSYTTLDILNFAKNIYNNDVAKFYYNHIEKDKYKRSENKNWYELDENSAYKQTPDSKPPESLLNDISDKIMKLFIAGESELKPPIIGCDDFDKKLKQYTEKRKIFNNAYKAVGTSKFTKGCIDYLSHLYTDKELDKTLDNDTSVVAFGNGS